MKLSDIVAELDAYAKRAEAAGYGNSAALANRAARDLLQIPPSHEIEAEPEPAPEPEAKPARGRKVED